MTTIRRNLSLFGLGLAATLSLVAAVNVGVDPSRLFRGGGPEDRLATALAAGKFVAGAENYDDRLAQRMLIGKLKTAPRTAVFGSSRIMPAGSAMLGDGVLNNAVSGGTLQDAVALLGLYEDRKILPQRVLLAPDPWVFNAHSQMNDWQSMADLVEAQKRRLNLSGAAHHMGGSGPSKAAAVVSLDYFLAALKTLGRPQQQNQWQERDDDHTSMLVRRADGSLKYPASTPNPAKISSDAVRWASADAVYAMSKYDRLAPDMIALFETQIDHLQKHDVDIVLTLLPFHPEAWRVLKARSDMTMIAAAEEYVRNTAAKKGLELLGSYDPDQAGCRASEFSDALHPAEPCLARILSRTIN